MPRRFEYQLTSSSVGVRNISRNEEILVSLLALFVLVLVLVMVTDCLSSAREHAHGLPVQMNKFK